MIKVTDGGPKDLWPPAIKSDPEQIALSYAIEQAAKLVLQFSRRTLMYASIDEQPEYILDYMAVESRTMYYEENMDVETKRAIIKNSLAWYMKAGTQGCVDELIETVLGGGKTIPWYEFSDGEGTPGTFDIIANTQMEPSMYERLTRIIEHAKNKSAVLRYISIEHELEGAWSARTHISAQEEGMISNDIHIDDPEKAMYLTEYAAISEEAQATDKTIVGGLDTTLEQHCMLTGAGFLTQDMETKIFETMTEADMAVTALAFNQLVTQTEQAIRRES